MRDVLLLEGKVQHCPLRSGPDGTSSVGFYSFKICILVGQSGPGGCGGLGQVQEADISEAGFTTVA